MENLKPLSLDAFRTMFPAFTAEEYPDAAVEIRLSLAAEFFADPPWKAPTVRNYCMGLFTAHFLMLYGSAAAGGTGTAAPASGLIASKSVDGASVSFDTSTGSFADAGFWNQTPYGKELWWYMQTFGAGAIQL